MSKKNFFWNLLICLSISIAMLASVSACTQSTTQSTTTAPKTQSTTAALTTQSTTKAVQSTTVAPTTQSTTTAAASTKTLKIGGIYTLSGEGAGTELFSRDGAVLGASWVNDNGGVTINGEKYQIELVIEDGKGTVEGCVAAATKLIEMDQVNYIVGGNRPDLIFAIQSITEPAKVIFSMGFGGGVPGEIGADKPYSFRPTPAGAEQIKVNFDYLVKTYPDAKTIALTGEQGSGGDFFASVAKAEAEARGIKVVATELFPIGSKDIYSVLTKILASKPDVIDENVAYAETMALVLKQARELGFTGPIMSAGQADMAVILNMVGKENGTNYFTGSVEVSASDTPKMLKTIESLVKEKLNGTYISDYNIGFDSVWCLAQAMEKAQSLDTTQISSAWENMTSIETSCGTGKMGGLQTYGANHLVVRQLPVTGLENGEAKTFEWVPLDIP